MGLVFCYCYIITWQEAQIMNMSFTSKEYRVASRHGIYRNRSTNSDALTTA